MNEAVQELTDSQWKLIEKIVNDQRQRWHSLRTILNAILSINRTGVQWRELDSKYPPWQTVYYHFRQFKLRGVWEEVLDSLVVKERVRQHRQETPSLLAIDSQTVKIMQFIAEETGVDGNKKINGRKRSVAVDRLGLPWSLAVTSANTSDNEAGRLVVDRLRGKVPRLEVIAADHGYKVSFIEHVEQQHGWQVEIAQKRSWLCAREEPLASRTQFWLVKFQASFVSGCGENGRKFGGHATYCLHLHHS